jgi:hypothetical protein
MEKDHHAPWLVMAYIDGGTLSQRYPRGSRLPLSQIVSFVNQLAPALYYVHEHHLVHQNIKAENIFIGPDDTLLLGDFVPSVVALHPSAEHEGESTLAAMPLEQSQGNGLPASDQYALAALVYEWLTGERWRAENLVDQPNFSLRQKFPALSPLIEHVLLTALKPDPTQRFKSVKAFATAFDQAYDESQGLLAGSLQPASAGLSIGAPEKRPRARGRRFLLLGACATVLLGLGAGFFISFINSGGVHTVLARPTSKAVVRPVQTPSPTARPTATLGASPVLPTATVAVPTPTVASAPVSVAGTVLYQADWSQGWSGGSADWNVVNGELVNNGSSSDQRAAPTIVAPYSVKSADYAVEMRARATAQWPCFDAGILRGFSDASGWHGYKAAVCDQKVRLQVDDNTIIAVPFQPGNGWHVYRFEVQGPNLRFFVDGALLVRAYDTHYSLGGQVGLKSYETYLEVSDLKIIAL